MGIKANIRSWNDIVDQQQGKSVNVHLHAPLSRQLGKPIYSVLDHQMRSLGHVQDAHIENPSAIIDPYKLEQSLNVGHKERHTLFNGVPVNPGVVGEAHPVKVTPGTIFVGEKPILQIKTGSGTVNVRGKGPQKGITVPRGQITRAEHFAAGLSFGRNEKNKPSVSAIDPRWEET